MAVAEEEDEEDDDEEEAAAAVAETEVSPQCWGGAAGRVKLVTGGSR